MKYVSLFCLVALGACKPASAPPAGRGSLAFPVEVELVTPRPVDYSLSAVGSVEAFERILVTARVAGAIERIRFVEGQKVNAQAVLAEIEPQRFQLAVRAAQANLARAQAQAAEAQAGLDRREMVEKTKPGLIRGEELETWKSRTLSAQAEESAAQVALEQAELNLKDAFVRAPISGVLQTRSVQTGQYVQPGTVLATLVRRDPLLLRFAVPEIDAARLGPNMRAQFEVRGVEGTLSAIVTHVADLADESTRMVAVTAEIRDDKKTLLRPGAFAEVSVPLPSSALSIVVPQTAVRPSERGFLAFVIEKEVAKERRLTLGLRTPDGRVEVHEGLKAGEALVVRGAEALKEGVKVKVTASTGDRP